jgi:hypothetical protein
MDAEKVRLIVSTIESQLELLKLEIGDRPINGPQFLTEDLRPLMTRRNSLANFVDYEPDYHEEED